MLFYDGKVLFTPLFFFRGCFRRLPRPVDRSHLAQFLHQLPGEATAAAVPEAIDAADVRLAAELAPISSGRRRRWLTKTVRPAAPAAHPRLEKRSVLVLERVQAIAQDG
jgi:hypothetical protein